MCGHRAWHNRRPRGGGDGARALRRTLVTVTTTVRRLGAALVLVCLAGGVTAGCSSNASTVLSKREVVVMFAPEASRAAMARVRSNCANVTPRTVAEPMPKADNGVNRRYGVRFRVDKASQQDLKVLFTCLKKDKSVVGVTQDDGGAG